MRKTETDREERGFDFKELGHEIVGAGKSKILRMAGRS